MPIELIFLIGFSFILFVFGVYYFSKFDDEIPVYIGLINLCFLWRLVAIQLGIAQWVNYNYGIPFEFNPAWGIKGFSYILLGMYLIVGSYCLCRKHHRLKLEDSLYFDYFIISKQNIIICGLILGPLVTSLSYSFNASGSSLSQSYVWLFPFFRASMIILGGLLMINKKKLSFIKFIIVGILVTVNISTTLVASGRFVLISWGIIFILFVADVVPSKKKSIIYISLGIVFLLLFTGLGMRRYQIFADLGFVELFQAAFFNVLQFNDFNMIDGLVMLLQVYPKYLEYSYGMGHLEILMRPIPRFLWPDKPVGAWQQKLAIAQAQDLYGYNATPELFGTGISPTLFGDFYAEAGLIGIIALSILYGWLFAKIINYSDRYLSHCRLLIKGILIASIFPLFRGGDLPGITAFILLAFWPLIIFIYFYNKKINQYIKYQLFSNQYSS
jgi:hypothetical protein